MATECKALRWLAAQAAPVRAGVVCPEWVAAWAAHRDASGVCFEDKEGWQYTPKWIEHNMPWLNRLAGKVLESAPRFERAELLSVLVEQVYDLARTVRPVSKSGKPAGKMLTYVGSFGRHFAFEALRAYADGLSAPRKVDYTVTHFGDVRDRNGGALVCEPAAPVPASPQSDLDFARWARELARRCPGARERLVELARMLADEERDAVQLVCGESRGLSEVGAIMHRTNGKVARLLASGLSRLAVLMRNKGLRPPVVRPAVQLTIEGV